MRAFWIAVLWAAVALAQPVVNAPPLSSTQYNICPELPAGPVPANGKQILYCKAGAGYCSRDSSGTERCTGSGGGGGSAHIIAGNGISFPAEPKLNFIGTGFPVADNVGASSTDVTLQAGPAGPTGPTGATGATGATGSSSGTTNALLDGVNHTDTLAGTVAQGDLIIGNATPLWQRLAKGAANTALTANGTTEAFTTVNDTTLASPYSGVGACAANTWASTLTRNAAPTCTAIPYSALTGTPSTFAPTAHNLLSASHGDTLTGSPVQGDLIVANATPAWAKLAKGAANTALTANGTTEAFTTINDTTLANAYSGAGTCGANLFETADNRNAAPTCTQPAFTNLTGAASAAQLANWSLKVAGITGTPTAIQTMTGQSPVPRIDLTTVNSMKIDASAGGTNNPVVTLGVNAPDCHGANQALNYTASTDAIACATISGGGGGGTCTDVCATLVCDGTTDDSAALQTLINSATTLGGSLCVTGGKTAAIAATVTPKSGVNLRCEGGAGFKATGAITTAIFKSTPAVNNFTLEGCTFDLNSKAGINAYYIEDGSNYHVWRNTVQGVGTGATSAYDLFHFDCTANDCDVTDNTITGSNTAATTDTAISSAGGKIQHNAIKNPGAIGISLLSGGSSASFNSISGSVYATGINVGNTRCAVVGNVITGLASAGGTGISSGSFASNISIGDNYIEGSGATASGISIGSFQSNATGNHIVSSPANSLQTGIVTVSSADRSIIANNTIDEMHDVAVWLKAGVGLRVSGNTSFLSFARPTAALQPSHVRLDDGPTQVDILDNYFTGGWRGIIAPTRTNVLTNTGIKTNRFTSVAGAAFAVGGAGLLIRDNYLNGSGAAGPTLVCDASCTGNRGTLCQQDSDCTTCSASVAKCLPEPRAGWWNSPYQIVDAAHPQWIGNLLFNAFNMTQQCQSGSGTATNVGALCQVSLSTCTGGGGTCAGGPPAVCTGGTQDTKLCCAGSGVNTCTPRTDTPYVRLNDYNSPGSGSISDGAFTGQNIFDGSPNTNIVVLDFLSSFNFGNLTITRMKISDNNLASGGATGIAIKWPTSVASFQNILIDGNNMTGWTTDMLNWKAIWGAASLPVSSMQLVADQTTSSTSFINVNDLSFPVAANRAYFFNCEITISSAGIGTGFAAAMSLGGVTPTTFTYISRLPALTVELTPGTDNMNEQEGNADDDTPTPITGVATANNKYTAAVRGNLIMGATPATLSARIKASNGTNALTIYKGSNCVLTPLP